MHFLLCAVRKTELICCSPSFCKKVQNKYWWHRMKSRNPEQKKWGLFAILGTYSNGVKTTLKVWFTPMETTKYLIKNGLQRENLNTGCTNNRKVCIPDFYKSVIQIKGMTWIPDKKYCVHLPEVKFMTWILDLNTAVLFKNQANAECNCFSIYFVKPHSIYF